MVFVLIASFFVQEIKAPNDKVKMAVRMIFFIMANLLNFKYSIYINGYGD